MLAGREVMVKKLSDFKERHKAKQSESIAILLARAAEEGDQEAISLLAAGALETRVWTLIGLASSPAAWRCLAPRHIAHSRLRAYRINVNVKAPAAVSAR
jgi:hypothetical protein